MTSVGIPREHGTPLTRHRGSALQRALLAAGVLSSLVYLANELLSAAAYPGYNFLDQALSELSAIGAPSRRIWSAIGPVYEVLLLAFAVGVFREGRGRRALRITGVLLLAFGVSGFLWPFFPMHERGQPMTYTDVGHLVLSAFTVLVLLAFVAVGSATLGARFRRYSLATVAAMFVADVVTFAMAPRVAANQPTPWMGAVERVIIYGYLLWIAVLSVALVRHAGAERAPEPRPAHW